MAEERVALVTGGARGIGAEVCRRLREQGRRVAIAFVADDVWYEVRQRQGQVDVAEPEVLAAGLSLEDDELVITGDPATDPLLVLHAAVTAARLDIPIERSSLRRLSERQSIFPDPWHVYGREWKSSLNFLRISVNLLHTSATDRFYPYSLSKK